MHLSTNNFSFEHDSIVRSASRDNLDDSNSFQEYYSECKREAATTPTTIIRAIHDNNSQPHQIQLKTEPVCHPSSPESTSVEVPNTASLEDCAGCGRLIQVNYYYKS